MITSCGSHELLEPHKRLHGVKVESYTDPTAKLYEALGMLKSLDPGREADKGEGCTIFDRTRLTTNSIMKARTFAKA